MKLLVFSDMRSSNGLPDVKPDLVALLGCIPSKVVHQIDKKYDCVKVGLLSNKCHPTLYEDTSIVNLHGKVVEVQNIRFAGFGGVPFYDEEDPYGQYKEEEVEHFVNRLKISDVDVLFSYTNLPYGDVDSPYAKEGFNAYNRIVLQELVKYFIHGRLQTPFQRHFGKVNIHSVYRFSEIDIQV